VIAEKRKLFIFCACRRERGAGASTSFDPPPAAPRMNSPSPSRGRKPASGARSSKSTTGVRTHSLHPCKLSYTRAGEKKGKDKSIPFGDHNGGPNIRP